MEYDEFRMFLISFTLFTSITTMLAACLCCRKKVPKNDLLGLEGMVKIKNPDDNNHGSHPILYVDTTDSGSDHDMKRASNAPHRSLPDIPVVDQVGGDTNSEFYETVGDKVQERPQGRSPTSSLKKQASVSQHSSLSQADDVSSPYARVRSPPHAYDKVRHAEHPYAQVQPGPSTLSVIVQDDNQRNPISRGDSRESLLSTNDTISEIPAASAIAGRVSASQELPYMTPPIVQPQQQQQQHFSGDSQDSSKGYTSISVREPLANIIAQTNKQNAQIRRRELTDSHYATVSDDSDEMYVAIDDPNNPVDLYTSGSETYAQIQPPNAMIVSVEINSTPNESEPINSLLTSQQQQQQPQQHRISASSNVIEENIMPPPPPPVDNLRAVHSRQASSSSCTSSIGNLGSPKPEKRQANSPLPPTPKISKNSNQYSSNSNLTNSSNQSGRTSVASSIIEVGNKSGGKEMLDSSKMDKLYVEHFSDSSSSKKKSPSKDLEGMYAKVMKKNKLSNLPSQNSSPILSRRSINTPAPIERLSNIDQDTFVTDSNISTKELPDFIVDSIHVSPVKNGKKSNRNVDNNYETIERKRDRSNNYDNRDPGYETIPGDKIINATIANGENSQIFTDKSNQQLLVDNLRSSAPSSGHLAQNSLNIFHGLNEPGYESLPDQPTSIINSDPGYEMVNQSGVRSNRSNSDYDPNYEELRPADKCDDEDGYSRIWDKSDKNCSGSDLNDGYSSIKVKKDSMKKGGEEIDDEELPGYSSIKEVKGKDITSCSKVNIQDPGYMTIDNSGTNKIHGYASIAETKKETAALILSNNNNEDEFSDIYASIPNSQNPSYLSIQDTTSLQYNYSTIPESILPNYSTINETSPSSTSISSMNKNNPSLVNSPGYSSISDTRTTPSSESTTSDTQIAYHSIRNSSNNIESKQQLHSSNYESLTESESDPNYESVKYLNVKENPYERLHNENSSISPDEKNNIDTDVSTLYNGPISNPSSSKTLESASTKTTKIISSDSTTSTAATEVGDYFQV